ncbi:MAG: SIS domain-containing protein [Erysipelotrichaceae bacterium]|nr:SIS domain-containing protein [Erysipelotrichaceae bacterium]
MEKTMLDYIRETPETLLNIIDRREEYTKQLVEFYRQNQCEGICLIASGSSYNGCLCTRPFMEEVLQTGITLITPFTFVHHESATISNQMAMAVSQSGCSTNTLEALSVLKQNGHSCVCLTGRDDCDAAKIADLTVNWQVGEEKVGFVTKGVASLACFLMVFTLELGKELRLIQEDLYVYYLDELYKSVKIHPEMQKKAEEIFKRNKNDFTGRNRVILLSSGPNFGTASEGALKIAETSCITSIAYEAEEFLHGPLYPSTPDDMIIVIDNENHSSSERILKIADALKDITEKVYVLSEHSPLDENHSFSTEMSADALVSPLYRLSCLQILAYLMSESTNRYEPHENVKKFKKANKVASKSRDNLYLDLQKIK